MPKPKTFVFNDGSKNSYGFLIPTKGINLKRFRKNPIMLDGHINSSQTVLGKWENIKSEDGILTGEPSFDLEDEYAAKIAGKVERGFVSSCSMGITFNPVDLKYINEELVLEKCELYEVSIVGVPSNENSIRLYSTDGELLPEKEVRKLCLSVLPVESEEINPKSNPNPKPMKIKLATVVLSALGFAKSVTEVGVDELEEKINALVADKEAAELKLSQMVEAQEQAELQAITEKVDAAITSGKISSEKRDKYIQLGVSNPEVLEDVLSSLAGKTSLSAKVVRKETPKVESVEDFLKLSLEEQLVFKQNHADEYQKLFTK